MPNRTARVSEALGDHVILAEMETCVKQHIYAALLECSALSRDLQMLDPDDVMKALWHEFRPDGSVADCFSDALGGFRGAVADAGGEPVAGRATVLSGVTP